MTTAGIYGAKRQSWYGKNPRDVLRRILLDSPHASEKEHFDRVCDAIAEDTSYFGAVLEYWFANNYRSMCPVEIEPHSVTVVPRETRAAAVRDEQVSIGRIKEKLYSALTMSFVMPNGKELRYCTFGYVAEIGGVFADMAKGHHAGKIVGKHLTDADLLNLQKRHCRTEEELQA